MSVAELCWFDGCGRIDLEMEILVSFVRVTSIEDKLKEYTMVVL